MLKIIIQGKEFWDETKEEFIKKSDDTELLLEHSLVSISKWESKWNKAFLGKSQKTYEETMDYIKCMTLNKNLSDSVYMNLNMHNVEDINKYIEAPMTATYFQADGKGSINHEIITSELIYYWMIALGIPFECQKWHLNRLLTLIRVCNIKNKPPKKMSTNEILNRNRALNEARKKQLNTKG